RVGGIQAQYAPSTYVGLWSRLHALSRDQVTRALERRRTVQATLMRMTIHVVARRDFWPLALGTRAARRARWLRTHPEAEAALRTAADRVHERLAGGRPLARSELETLVGRPLAAGVGQWVDLVRLPPSGTWERRRADLFGLAENWVGPPEGSEEEGRERLVRRYLAAFGPASRADLSSWAGVPVRVLDSAIDAVASRRLRGEDGTELLDLPRAPLPDPATPAPVRLLPTWDATLLVHARRTGLLPDMHRPRIFSSRNPHSHPTFLVDGVVAGTWRHEDGRIALQPFGRLDAADRRALAEEAERLAAFIA
ncbi:MAG TPA: winged helix DNA-binding domain-containing protein, partial [Solirubrobacteraceae bacterium]|nr:winged helix DNA-binding domain-containing protein [Solirubrobacteraceae bacterium]